MSIYGASTFLKTYKIEVTESELTQCFALSKIPVIDENDQSSKLTRMSLTFVENNDSSLQYLEFLEFVVRVSDVINDDLNLTIDKKLDELINRLKAK